MTTNELYSIYVRAYHDYQPFVGETVSATVRTAIERAIVEFAVEDAANGAPLRSREQFNLAVEAGFAALAPLGLRAA